MEEGYSGTVRSVHGFKKSTSAFEKGPGAFLLLKILDKKTQVTAA